MELRQLRYFVVVAEELHFGRAAARLHLSQPPLSTQIRALERELGVTLLERSTRRVALTPAGEHFRDRARSLLDDLDEAVAQTRDAQAGRRGVLRIGFVSSANFSVLPAGLRRFRRDRPQVTVDLSPLTSSEQVGALHAGSIDVGLIRTPMPGTGLSVRELLVEPFIALVPRGHALAARAEVGIEELVDEPLILFPYAAMPGFVGQVLRMYDAVGRAPIVAQQAIHHETAIGLVAAGVGVTILPQSAGRIATSDVVPLPIRDSLTSALAIAQRPGEQPAAAQHFVRCLREVGSSARRPAGTS